MGSPKPRGPKIPSPSSFLRTTFLNLVKSSVEKGIMSDQPEKDKRDKKDKKEKKEKKDKDRDTAEKTEKKSEKSEKVEKDKTDKLPKEIREGVTAFETSLAKLEAAFEPLLATSVDELVASKSPMERAKIMVTSAYAINTLCYS